MRYFAVTHTSLTQETTPKGNVSILSLQ